MTREEYNAVDAVNYSTLKHLLVSPAHYLAALKRPNVSTPAMQMGTLLHAAWLENKLFDHVVKPDGMTFATKEGKQWRDEHAGKLILTAEEDAQLRRKLQALNESKLASGLLASMEYREHPVFSELNGVKVKMLFDGIGEAGVIDLKTTTDNSPKAFGETILRFNYDLQAAMGIRLWRKHFKKGSAYDSPYWWITVSDDPYPVVAVYNVSPFGTGGMDKLEVALEKYKNLMRDGEQPINAEMPYWALREAA